MYSYIHCYLGIESNYDFSGEIYFCHQTIFTFTFYFVSIINITVKY